MKIGELAKRAGLTASRIRFYESNGLLQAVERQANGYREYPAEALLALEIITSAQNAGFSLDEVRSLMPSSMTAWEPDKLIPVLEQKLVDIAAMEERLAQSKAQLMALIDGVRNRPKGLDCAVHAKRLLDRMRDGVPAADSVESVKRRRKLG